MEIEISDCQPTIAKNVLYCYKDFIWLYQIFLLTIEIDPERHREIMQTLVLSNKIKLNFNKLN
jgi:hypothetical protein